MPELVIVDGLTPPLQGPHCGHPFVRGSVAVSSAGAHCPSCGSFFSVLRLPPPGISVADAGRNWRIDISARTPKAAWGAFVSSVGFLLVAVGEPVLLVCIYWLWGRHSISVRGFEGEIFKGLGKIGIRRRFALPTINGVCLTKVVTESHGHDVEQHIIRLEGVDFYLDFGAGLPDQQRAFIALFPLQKRAAVLCGSSQRPG